MSLFFASFASKLGEIQPGKRLRIRSKTPPQEVDAANFSVAWFLRIRALHVCLAGCRLHTSEENNDEGWVWKDGYGWVQDLDLKTKAPVWRIFRTEQLKTLNPSKNLKL